jgi:hypothetical protein
MTTEFDLVRETFSRSVIGQLMANVSGRLQSAWGLSISGRTVHAVERTARTAPAAARIRFIGIAIFVASIVQPAAVAVMPSTVVPAMPAMMLIVVAGGGLLAGLMPAALAHAWRSSIAARQLSR